MKTAKELFYEMLENNGECTSTEMMIEFAKIHVKQALEQASEEAKTMEDPDSYCGNTGSEYPPDVIVDKSSILESYNLDNIV